MARTCLGLDIGASSVKAVQLKQTRKGLQLCAFGFEPLPPQTIVDGAIMNQTAVVDAIQSLTGGLKLRSKEVATALAGHSVIIKKIKIADTSADNIDREIFTEAERHIPFAKDDVEMDYQVLGKEEGQLDVILVAVKKEVVADYTLVLREARLQPAVMDVAAFSIQNAFEVNYQDEAKEVVALINIGATMTNINILAGGTSAFTRDVAGGGQGVTEELQRRLHVGQEEAEAWKVGGSGEGEVLPDEVHAVLADTADQMAGKLQRSLEFFLSARNDVTLTRIYLCGGCAKMTALQRALEEKARAPVEIMDPFRKVAVDPHKVDVNFLRKHAAEAAVAVGLALRRPGDKS